MMIYDWSRDQARKNSDRIAITLLDRHVTYGEIESVSNQLAGGLLAEGLKPGDRVGLYMAKTPETIIAMLGISKAGGVYVPLDYQSPAKRVSEIIHSSMPSFLMVDHAAINQFQNLMETDPTLKNIPWIWWSQDRIKSENQAGLPLFTYAMIEMLSDTSHQVVRDEQAPAHILFTSGSTGRPKGVVITHKNIHSFIQWAVPYFDMGPGDKTSCHSPFHFDLSTFDIYGSFAAGSHLFLVPPEMSVIPQKLVDFILKNELTQWFSVPSALSYMATFNSLPEGGFPHLKRLIWCGEVFPLPALQYWMNQLPGVAFTNLYGPTEATIASSYYTVPDIPETGTELPIGRPCAGEKIMILDQNIKPVKTGEIGDLYISGSGLSPGYWNDSTKTASVFIWYKNEKGEKERIYKTGDLGSIGLDGLFYYHGRSDYQIKSRGYRIELGEIEAALGDADHLREYAVVPVRKGGFEGTAIGCAYVSMESKTGNKEIPPYLKKILVSKVPSYMVPQIWMEYEKLPRNNNGKIDRKKITENFEKH